MKHFDVLVNALQDIIEESFKYDVSTGVGMGKNIRKIAQKALTDYKEKAPKPEFSCPYNHEVGKDYNKSEDCSMCPPDYAQPCCIYNYVWHR